jgi:CheY-like chemotaxis protein
MAPDRICVLVVDDDPDVRELIEQVFERLGIEVIAAPSVDDALSTLEWYTPDVVISDIGMPDRDGYSLIRSIRAHPADAKRDIPAIALTAFATPKDRARALSSGFSLHMAKPVELPALARAVTELAAERQAAS